MNEAIAALHAAERAKLYGEITIKFELGKVVLIRETRTTKPLEPHYANTRGTDGNAR